MKLKFNTDLYMSTVCLEKLSHDLQTNRYHVKSPSINIEPAAPSSSKKPLIVDIEKSDKNITDVVFLAARCAQELNTKLIINTPSGETTSIKWQEIKKAAGYAEPLDGGEEDQEGYKNSINLYSFISNKVRPMI